MRIVVGKHCRPCRQQVQTNQKHLRFERAGFKISRELTLQDRELAFEGPASAEILEAWGLRFDRMKLLQDFCGADFAHVHNEFLRCLEQPEHHSLAKVQCCTAIK